MFTMLIFFLGGAVFYRILQFILSITPNYNIYKQVELTSLKLISEIYVQKHSSLKILNLLYEEQGKTEEYKILEKQINLNFETIINNCILNIKKNIPYTVPYDNLEQAIKYYSRRQKDE